MQREEPRSEPPTAEALVGDLGPLRPDAIDVFIHHDGFRGVWVVTPLSGAQLELGQVGSSGEPLTGFRGVVWTLDETVFDDENGQQPRQELEDFAEGVLAAQVSRRMKRVATAMKQLKAVTIKLQEKLSRHQEDVLALQGREAKLQQGWADIGKRSQVHQESVAALAHDRRLFTQEVRIAAEHFAKVLQTPVNTGTAVAFPSDVFFLAAQDDFGHFAPQLSTEDEAELKHVRLTPEAAFRATAEEFSKLNGGVEDLQGHIDVTVHGLLAVHCMRPGKVVQEKAQVLDHLMGISQALCRSAAADGRRGLAFAAACSALWCGLRLDTVLTQQGNEANPSEVLKGLEFPVSLRRGPDPQQIRALAQHCLLSRRVLRAWQDWLRQRHTFVQFAATTGREQCQDADLRLLMLGRTASAAELAAHVRRLSRPASLTSGLPPEKRRKVEAEVHKPVEKDNGQVEVVDLSDGDQNGHEG